MTANELRIGNLVYYDDDVIEVEAYQLYILTDYFEPIPLTEEWLLRFGFNTISDRIFFYGNFGYEFGITNRAVLKNEKHFVLFPKIKYVHQLQNLYFALTGEELTLNQ